MTPKALPSHWQIKKLGEVCKKITKGATPTTYGFAFLNKGVNFIKVENVKKGKLLKESIKTFISEEAHEYQNKSKLETNDLLFSIAGTLGDTCLIQSDYLPANTNQAFAIIRGFSESLKPKYLDIQLSFCTKQYVKEKARGGAMNNISLEDLKQFELIIPPLPEQEAIVAKIESLFAELEAGKSALIAAREQIKLYRQSLLKAAFEGKLTEKSKKPLERGQLPDGWKWVKLGEVIKVSSGKGIKINELQGGNYPVYGGNGLNGYHSEYLFEERKLIIGRVGVKCGVMHITEPNSWISDNALIVNPITNEFNLTYFKHRLQYENLNKLSVSTAQPVISGASIYKIELPLPPLSMQEKIVAILDEKLGECDALDATIEKSITDAELLRQSILKEAFEGRLVKMEKGKKGNSY
jgi:type I restriction enzyme S subunit